MGKTRTDVATQAIRAIPNDRVPNSVSNGVVKSLLKNGEVVDHVIEEAIASIGVRAERAYNYAKDGGYAFGVPKGKFTNPSSQTQAEVESVLRSLHSGSSVQLDYLHLGVPNNLHMGWMALIQNHGYNPESNQLTVLGASKGVPVYLNDLVVLIPETELLKQDPESLKLWGVAACSGYTPQRTGLTDAARSLIKPTPVKTHIGTSELLEVEYIWTDPALGVQTAKFTITTDELPGDSLYYQAKYFTGGKAYYWIYKDGSGSYPALDRVRDRAYEAGGSFFPFVYFRHDKKSVIHDKTSAEYKTSKKLMKKLGMDYDALAKSVDENPAIDDVEQAVMMFAVPADAGSEIERAYLWAFFNNLYLSQDPADRYRSEQTANMGLAARVFNTLTAVTPSVVIQDTRFKMSLQCAGIFKKAVAGKIAEVGKHTSGYDSSTDTHFYRKQVSFQVYEEVRVKNLETVFRIYGGWSVTAGEFDKTLLIPLDHSITEFYSIPEREELYARSIHYVFNSRVVTKLKWYQTGVFKAILFVVAVVMTIYTWGSTMGAIGSALVNGAYATAAYLALTILVEYLVVTMAMKLFVKLVGVKFAIIAAIVAAVAGVAIAIDAGSLSGAPWASDLLTVASNISNAVTNKTVEDFADLLNQQKEFELLVKEQTELLDTANQLLYRTTHLDPITIFGEKPDDFYNRTVHSGNTGAMSIEAISSFVDMKLALPKLAETIKEGGA